MRLIFYIILIILTVSCSVESDNYIKRKDIVHISEALIPDTSNNFEIVKIRAKAVETNGCWSDLFFVMEKKSEFEYSLKAFGTYESNGVCPTVMVYKDTIIGSVQLTVSSIIFLFQGPPKNTRVLEKKNFIL